MTVCGVAAGVRAHCLPDDACRRVPGMGCDWAETSKEYIHTLCCLRNRVCMKILLTSLRQSCVLNSIWFFVVVVVFTVDPSGNDAGDWLRSRWYCITGRVDPGRDDHHPPASLAGPGDSESTERVTFGANTEKPKAFLDAQCYASTVLC